MTRYTAIWRDATGIPRAYGHSDCIIDAQAIAIIELEAYKDEHFDRQEPFTLTVHPSGGHSEHMEEL
jgi:hypothetical protein